MFYQKYEPADSLKPFIHTYYIWEDQSNAKSLVIESPPSAYCALVFNLGEEYKAGIYGDKLTETNRIFFAGQATKSYTLELKGAISMVGVVLNASSLYHFLGVSMDKYVNKREDATKFLGESISIVYQKLCMEAKPESRIRIVDEFFRFLIGSKKVKRSSFDESVDYIDENLGNTSPQDVIGKFGFTSRYYQKLFLKKVGVTPKSYMRMRRMSHVCYLLSTQTEINWQDIVFEGGYFDQSHFIKDFLEFVGRNPSVYFKNNQELVNLLG